MGRQAPTAQDDLFAKVGFCVFIRFPDFGSELENVAIAEGAFEHISWSYLMNGMKWRKNC